MASGSARLSRYAPYSPHKEVRMTDHILWRDVLAKAAAECEKTLTMTPEEYAEYDKKCEDEFSYENKVGVLADELIADLERIIKENG
jgi:hypothetical protein